MSMLHYFMIFISICSPSILCERKDIHHMMYETFKNAAMCFRILNGTGQFGCSTSKSGSSGVLHLINSDSDVDWVLEKGNTGPYMVVVPPSLFVNSRDVMFRLNESPKIAGVLLAMNESDRPQDMSPDDSCPNRHSSLEGSCSEAAPWNSLGTGFLLVDWTMPVFVVKDADIIAKIHECFRQFNLPLEGGQERSLCSLQMTGHMYAAVDTATCLRRNTGINSFTPRIFCDPMGDQNVFAWTFPRKSDPIIRPVVLVIARLDTAAMFDGLAPGAMSTVSGLVTLLTTAHILSRLLPQQSKATYQKNVLFGLLNGESHDYIGSTRLVYDIKEGKFPSSSHSPPLSMEQIDQVIDLHQLDGSGQLFAHCLTSPVAQNTVEKMTKLGQLFNISVKNACDTSSLLPPSSLHSFLKSNKSLPGLVLTNHQSRYINRYYNSMLDDSKNLVYQYANGSAVGAIQRSLVDISRTLALTLAQMVDPSITWPDNRTDLANTTVDALVDELLFCYLESRQCGMFRNLTLDSMVGEGPLPLYVGVTRSRNTVTLLTIVALGFLTGHPGNFTYEQCHDSSTPGKDEQTLYNWVTGTTSGPGVCYESNILTSPAVSPAFEIENYNWSSGEFPSWTESVWNDFSLRMYLRPSYSQELTSLIAGLTVLLLSFIVVYFVNRNANVLFDPMMSRDSDELVLLDQPGPSDLYGFRAEQLLPTRGARPRENEDS